MSGQVDLPPREPGLWLDATSTDCTEAGCNVCGWHTEGPYREVRESAFTHSHDPLFDIRQRLDRILGDESVVSVLAYQADVSWLLSLLEKP